MSLVDSVGKSYVIDHYIAFFKKEMQDKSYRIYVTDALQLLTKKFGGEYLKNRFYDVIEPHIEETRTAEEVINDIRNKIAGL
jgi:tRNA A-37 threonylcarbamoyl transferase component Bud32